MAANEYWSIEFESAIGLEEDAMTAANVSSNSARTTRGFLRLCLLALALGALLVPTAVSAQDDLPHYCKTSVGVLGPYPNPGSVQVGDTCFGSKNGRRYWGTAVMGPDRSDDTDDRPSGNSRRKEEIPHYCSTDVGVLGPYPNDGSVHVGEPCFGTKNGRRHEGTAVVGR
jgi:hypothetical protein